MQRENESWSACDQPIREPNQKIVIQFVMLHYVIKPGNVFTKERRNWEIERWNTQPKYFNMLCHLWPEKLPKHSYSISDVVLRDKTEATWGNLCEARGMSSQEKVGRNSDIERWNTAPKQFNRMCHLLLGKLQKIAIQFLMLYYVSTWRANKETYVKFGTCHHTKR